MEVAMTLCGYGVWSSDVQCSPSMAELLARSQKAGRAETPLGLSGSAVTPQGLYDASVTLSASAAEFLCRKRILECVVLS